MLKVKVWILADSFDSGVVQLACLFAPKVYVVLCKPEKNTREGVMAHHRTSSYALATPPTAGFNSQNQGFQSSINGGQMNRQHPPSLIENRDSTLTTSCKSKWWRSTNICIGTDWWKLMVRTRVLTHLQSFTTNTCVVWTRFKLNMFSKHQNHFESIKVQTQINVLK